jgi:hypothetical protein
MNVFPKMFSSTKNIPYNDGKHQKPQKHTHAHPHGATDKPFSKPYNPQDDFDFTELLKRPQQYHFSLNPAVIFPRENPLPFGQPEVTESTEKDVHGFELKGMSEY